MGLRERYLQELGVNEARKPVLTHGVNDGVNKVGVSNKPEAASTVSHTPAKEKRKAKGKRKAGPKSDRHAPGYMKEYMRKRRAALSAKQNAV